MKTHYILLLFGLFLIAFGLSGFLTPLHSPYGNRLYHTHIAWDGFGNLSSTLRYDSQILALTSMMTGILISIVAGILIEKEVK